MLYIISKEGGIFEDDKRKLLEHSQLSREHREAINNLSLMGVQVTKDRRLPGEKSLRKRLLRRRTNKDEDQPYELSRYAPALKKSMDVSGQVHCIHTQYSTLLSFRAFSPGSWTLNSSLILGNRIWKSLRVLLVVRTALPRLAQVNSVASLYELQNPLGKTRPPME